MRRKNYLLPYMVECLIIFTGNFSNNFEIYLWKKNFFGEMRYFIMRQNGSDLKPESHFNHQIIFGTR
ncbi:uncharacterized protein OCT59_014170 [Rhizophagus irregularis]|uniref:uncharacterized protein n=1 Tax=Rhizophagus irregularis TaxID=588596 RepID=UPI0033254424|nr:hypothetical protein OCT59_014170 [Rhizophagus irregularis]